MNLINKIIILCDKFLLPIYDYPGISGKKKIFNAIKFQFLKKNLLISFSYIFYFIFIEFFSYVFFPLALILSYFFLILKVDLSQIGSIHYLNLAIKENLLKKNKKKIIVFASKKYDKSNNYLIKLYSNSKEVIIIYDIFIRLLLLPLSNIPILTKNTFRFDGSYPTHHKSKYCIAQLVWQNYENQNLNPLVELNSHEIKRCEKFLSANNINYKKFVAIHLRTSHFLKESHESFRNCTAENYIPTIKFLIEKGYDVIRIGSYDFVKENFQIPGYFQIKNLLDISDQSFNELIDIYLLSKCVFYIGTNSGPSFIPCTFGINSCLTNFHPASISLGYLKGDLSIFKKIKDNNLNRYLKNYEYFQEPIMHFLFKKDFQKFNLMLQENTSDEILNCCKNYLIDKNSLKKIISNKEYSNIYQINKYSISFNANGRFDTSFIKNLINK